MCIVLFLFFILLLCAGIRLRARLSIELRQARLWVEARLFFGAVKLRGRVTVCWFPVALYVNDKLCPLPEKNKGSNKLMNIAMKGSRLKEINVNIGVGIRNDGAKSVIIAGVLREFTRGACLLLMPDKLEVAASPIFSHGTFWMDLEGIAMFYPVQIIHAAIRQKISEMRKGK